MHVLNSFLLDLSRALIGIGSIALFLIVTTVGAAAHCLKSLVTWHNVIVVVGTIIGSLLLLWVVLYLAHPLTLWRDLYV